MAVLRARRGRRRRAGAQPACVPSRPLRASLPAVTTVNPVFSVVIGMAVFDEPFRTAPGNLIGEVLGLALMAVGAICLTRGHPEHDGDLWNLKLRAADPACHLPEDEFPLLRFILKSDAAGRYPAGK